MFKAWVITKTEDQPYRVTFKEVETTELPKEPVLVRISHSGVNYKDALALTGKAPVVRRFPLVPGIDFGGVVEASESPLFSAGEKVLLTGWEVGEVYWGGFSEYASVRPEWLIKIPSALSVEQAMAIGTAGLTAMLSVMALERFGIRPDQGPVLVTGAGGGVGGFAITLLAHAGYSVVAATGRLKDTEYLKSLGASEVIERTEITRPGKPLAKERWAAAVDTLGSHALVNICSSLRRGGAVAACGMAQGLDLPASVAPFILRGIALLGIDSVLCPHEQRVEAWDRLAGALDLGLLKAMTQHRPLAEALTVAEELLAGKIRGRVVLNM